MSGGVDERTRLDPSGWAGLERIALSTAGRLTAAFGAGGAARRHLVRSRSCATSTRPGRRSPPRSRCGCSSPASRSSRSARAPRRSAPGPATCASARRARRSCSRVAALATVLATCVAVAHGDSERDQRHERQLAIAENDLRHATVGPVDRLTDVASTVQGPLSVRRSQFDALAARLLDRARARPRWRWRAAPAAARPRARAPTTPPGARGATRSSTRPRAARARRAARRSSCPPGAPRVEGAIRSGETRATEVLPAVDGSPPSIAVAVPVRASARRRVGRVPRDLLAPRRCARPWPRTCRKGTRFSVTQGASRRCGSHVAKQRPRPCRVRCRCGARSSTRSPRVCSTRRR